MDKPVTHSKRFFSFFLFTIFFHELLSPLFLVQRLWGEIDGFTPLNGKYNANSKFVTKGNRIRGRSVTQLGATDVQLLFWQYFLLNINLLGSFVGVTVILC